MRAIKIFSKLQATTLLLVTLWFGYITIGLLVYQHTDADIIPTDIIANEGVVGIFETVLPAVAVLCAMLLFTAVAVHPHCCAVRRSALMLLLFSFYDLVTVCIELPSYWDSSYTLNIELYDVILWTDVAVSLLFLVGVVVFTSRLKRPLLTLMAFLFSVLSLIGIIHRLLMSILPDISETFWEDFITSDSYLSTANIINVVILCGFIASVVYYFRLPSALQSLAAADAPLGDVPTVEVAVQGAKSKTVVTPEMPVVPKMPETPKFPPIPETKE